MTMTTASLSQKAAEPCFVFKTSKAWQPHARQVRLLYRSVAGPSRRRKPAVYGDGAMALKPIYASVSFARTPLSEIGRKVEELEALGWRQDDRRGDPWVVFFVKDFPEEAAGEATAELRSVIGDYWLEPEEIRLLRHDVSDPGITL
jgi:hypothetical protein